MIIKFEGGKVGNSWSKYVINGTEIKPRDHNKIELIDGDLAIGDAICDSTNYAENYYKVLISFQGKLDKNTQKDVYNEFKNLFMYGFDEEDYHIDAVAHSDSDNDHIHIRIPKKHLQCDKQLRLYMHNQDVDRINLIRDHLVTKYNLNHDLNEQALVKERSTKYLEEWTKDFDKPAFTFKSKKGRNTAENDINNYILDLSNSGTVNDIDDVKNILNELKLDVVNAGHDTVKRFDYITVKDAHGNKLRLKGELYGEGFWERKRADREKQISDTIRTRRDDKRVTNDSREQQLTSNRTSTPRSREFEAVLARRSGSVEKIYGQSKREFKKALQIECNQHLYSTSSSDNSVTDSGGDVSVFRLQKINYKLQNDRGGRSYIYDTRHSRLNRLQKREHLLLRNKQIGNKNGAESYDNIEVISGVGEEGKSRNILTNTVKNIGTKVGKLADTIEEYAKDSIMNLSFNICKSDSIASVKNWENITVNSLSGLEHYMKNYPYSNADFKDGYRKNDNVKTLGQALIFDVDNDPDDTKLSLIEATEKLKNSGYTGVIIPSKSHQIDKKNKGIQDRFRIVIFSDNTLDDGGSKELYKATMLSVAEHLNIANSVDKKALNDRARFYYSSPKNATMTKVIGNKFIDINTFVDIGKKEIDANLQLRMHEANTSVSSNFESNIKNNNNVDHDKYLDKIDMSVFDSINIVDAIKEYENIRYSEIENEWHIIKTDTAKYAIKNNIAHEFKSGENFNIVKYLTTRMNKSFYNVAAELGALELNKQYLKNVLDEAVLESTNDKTLTAKLIEITGYNNAKYRNGDITIGKYKITISESFKDRIIKQFKENKFNENTFNDIGGIK